MNKTSTVSGVSSGGDDSSEAPWWVQHAKSLGLPSCVLIALIYMIWAAGVWVGSTIVVPLFERQMLFIDEASKMTKEMSQSAASINKAIEAQSHHAIEAMQSCRRIEDTTTSTNSDVRVMQKSHDQMIGVLKDIEENTKPLRETH